MTRLIPSDIAKIGSDLSLFDDHLKKLTGLSLWELACHAAGLENPNQIVESGSIKKIAVIPVKSGLGIISGFTTGVKAIINYLGFEATCTNAADVAGLAEAVENDVEFVFMADDDRFVVFDLNNRTLADNTPAVAKGFVAALNLMAKGLLSQKVLVLGCGPVGYFSVRALSQRGAMVSVYERDEAKSQALLVRTKEDSDSEITIETSLVDALGNHRLIIDATNAADIINTDWFHQNSLVVAPGIPCGITSEAMKKFPCQILHDPLQLGVAAMLAQILLQRDGQILRTQD